MIGGESVIADLSLDAETPAVAVAETGIGPAEPGEMDTEAADPPSPADPIAPPVNDARGALDPGTA